MFDFMKSLKAKSKKIKVLIDTKVDFSRYKDTHKYVDMNLSEDNSLRVNLLLPNLSTIYGGAMTALSIFEKLYESNRCDARIIVFNGRYKRVAEIPEEFYANNKSRMIELLSGAENKITVRNNDIFIATAWHTANCFKEVIRQQQERYNIKRKLVYLIQDYEPAFYRWGTDYAEAERSYHGDIDIVGVFNSKELQDFFVNKHYVFKSQMYFEPCINSKLKNVLMHSDNMTRENIIIFYGRPSIHRNAFTLAINALLQVSKKVSREEADSWRIISLGEYHKEIKLFNGMRIKSLGKCSLEEYGTIMLKAKIGLSLMMSPHPSYPPLEMSTFGVKTITNCFENKDLTGFNSNIICLKEYSADMIAKTMLQLMRNTDGEYIKECDTEYVTGTDVYSKVIQFINDSVLRNME